MVELNDANNNPVLLNDVRIIQIPPCTVASSHYIGKTPEQFAGNQLLDFIKVSDLYEKKPDARVFGFNHPNPSDERPDYGYEFWITIPEDLEVPAPFKKLHFNGGMYAAHCIKMGDFHEWEWLCRWVDASGEYAPNYSAAGSENMGGCLEEHLNFMQELANNGGNWPGDKIKLDLLIPIKKVR
jgi:DNA gyrase inhibitor GyrI